LVPSLTELLFDLGLGGSLVGRTRYCVHPAEGVKAVPVVGGTKQVKRAALEALAVARPTHVVLNIDENTRETAAQLEALGARLVVTHPLHPDDNLPLYELFGRLFGREAEAEALRARFVAARATLAESAQGLPARRVLYLIWRSPWMTTSRDTYIAQMLALANMETAGHDPTRRYPEVDLARDDLRDLDAWLLSSEPYPFTAADAQALEASHPARAGRVRCVDGEALSWYGSRAIAGLRYVGALARSLPDPVRRS
jgi:ABC-type Fe3+-hydroxamate transport system substrate-binding protein